MTDYYVANYDNEASGPFVAEGANLTWAGGVGFIVTLIDDGTTGKLAFALVSGAAPNDNDVLTQGATTANVNEPIAGAAKLLLYPAYFREDVQVASSGSITWTGPALGATGAARLEAFELLDQNGRPSAIAMPGKTTLVYFYRGDW